jgi:hypothetical protein
VWLKKHRGGSSIGPHQWPEDGSVCEVPDDLGRSILAIPEHDYELVEAPKPAPKAAPKAAEAAKAAPPAAAK